MSEVPMATPEPNGAAPSPIDDAAIESIRAAVVARQARVDELQAELAALGPELKRYERALALLLDKVPPSPLLGRPKGQKVREKPSGVSEERLAAIEAAIHAYAQDHEEFRQVDVRATLSGPLSKSSTSAIAFETLRQRNVIRVARVSGNSKYYRLTREALRAGTDE